MVTKFCLSAPSLSILDLLFSRERQLAEAESRIAMLESLLKKTREKTEQRMQQVTEKEKAVATWEKEFVAIREEQRGACRRTF